jgi:O-methyltransferase
MLGRIRSTARALARPGAPQSRDPGHQDMGEEFQRLYETAKPYTMTTIERMYALHQACRYVVKSGVRGDIVECGVWRGGSSMLAALSLLALTERRPLWLYDTFEGMPEPGALDKKWSGEPAADLLALHPREAGAANTWAYATLDDVRRNMAMTGYPIDELHYVQGKVEDTIPASAPDRVALLRLDTDWYESTRHELEHLWPRLSTGGVLIVDDYGHWQGARQATDEFFHLQGAHILWHRVDYTGRVTVKL